MNRIASLFLLTIGITLSCKGMYPSGTSESYETDHHNNPRWNTKNQVTIWSAETKTYFDKSSTEKILGLTREIDNLQTINNQLIIPNYINSREFQGSVYGTVRSENHNPYPHAREVKKYRTQKKVVKSEGLILEPFFDTDKYNQDQAHQIFLAMKGEFAKLK